jgi:hypothetical protein
MHEKIFFSIFKIFVSKKNKKFSKAGGRYAPHVGTPLLSRLLHTISCHIAAIKEE